MGAEAVGVGWGENSGRESREEAIAIIQVRDGWVAAR